MQTQQFNKTTEQEVHILEENNHKAKDIVTIKYLPCSG